MKKKILKKIAIIAALLGLALALGLFFSVATPQYRVLKNYLPCGETPGFSVTVPIEKDSLLGTILIGGEYDVQGPFSFHVTPEPRPFNVYFGVYAAEKKYKTLLVKNLELLDGSGRSLFQLQIDSKIPFVYKANTAHLYPKIGAHEATYLSGSIPIDHSQTKEITVLVRYRLETADGKWVVYPPMKACFRSNTSKGWHWLIPN